MYFATQPTIGGIMMRHERKLTLRDESGRLESLDISNPLPHINSDLCWCDPIVEFNEYGDQRIIHMEVTWN
jgi:hypothetical protein